MMTEWQGQGDGDCVRSTLKLALRDIEGEVHYVRAGERASERHSLGPNQH